MKKKKNGKYLKIYKIREKKKKKKKFCLVREKIVFIF